jgi:putative two-component system response regulator
MKTVLIVDDEPDIRRLLTHTLENRGFRVLAAEGGLEALALAEAGTPDLIVLDVMMPGMDGHAVHDRLRSRPETATTPIVFLSAVGTFEEQATQMADEHVDYLSKPFSPADVAAHIEAMLDPSRSDDVARDRSSREARLQRIVNIMRREHGD